MVIRLTVFFFALSLFSFSYSQKGRTVAQPKTETKQKELSKLREEISTIEGQLNKIGTKEKKTFSTIEKFNKQIFLINKLVSNLKEEEEEKQMQIEEIQGQSENLQKELDNLKKNYSSYVNATYKKLYQNKSLYLLSAKSISQGILRQYYLKTFSERGKGDAERIARTQFDLRKLEEEISREKNIKQAIIVQKSEEELRLTSKSKEQQVALKKIKGDKTQLKKELDEKKLAESRIRDIVAKLIARDKERERQREIAEKELRNKNASKKPGATAKEPEVTVRKTPEPISGALTSLKGKMGWPVSGNIIHHYGENRNSSTNTVSLSYGVDIKTSSNAPVKSIYAGEVSAIEFLPGYRTVIIISHGSEFRSVYGNLGSVNVREGQKIAAGTVIGSAGESIEGYQIHFEIWSERRSQNPEVWLSRK